MTMDTQGLRPITKPTSSLAKSQTTRYIKINYSREILISNRYLSPSQSFELILLLQNGEILDNFFLIKNFHSREDGEEEELTQIHSDPSSHHYSLRPHYELLRRINQNHQSNTTNELYPFPLIEIISG